MDEVKRKSNNEEQRLKIKDLVKAAHRNSNISTVLNTQNTISTF